MLFFSCIQDIGEYGEWLQHTALHVTGTIEWPIHGLEITMDTCGASHVHCIRVREGNAVQAAHRANQKHHILDLFANQHTQDGRIGEFIA